MRLTCMALAIAILGGVSGCGSSVESRGESFPVFWNTREDLGHGFYIYSRSAMSLERDVLLVRREEVTSVGLDLEVWNRTGRMLFLAEVGDPATFLTWRIRSVSTGGVSEHEGRYRHGYVGSERIFRLLSCPELCNGSTASPVMMRVAATIPLPWDQNTQYMDLEVTFPLHYCVLGESRPATVVVRRSMRIELAP